MNIEHLKVTPGLLEQVAMRQALERLKAVFPNDIVAINFQLEHDPVSEFTVPCFMACFGFYRVACGSTPDHAVNKLLRVAGITRVEEYVCTQVHQEKQVNP